MALCGAYRSIWRGSRPASCITTIDSVGSAAATTIEAVASTSASKDAKGLARSRSRSVRLLPVRPDHVCFCAACGDSKHEDFYPANEKLSFVEALKVHQLLATHPTGGARKPACRLEPWNAKWLSEPGIRRLVPRDQCVRTGAGARERERTQGNPRLTRIPLEFFHWRRL
jgi:hypothetical protein